jgi:uncharacterized membrane protein
MEVNTKSASFLVGWLCICIAVLLLLLGNLVACAVVALIGEFAFDVFFYYLVRDWRAAEDN